LRLYFKGNERLRGYRYGDVVKVDSLDPRDREELLRIGWGSFGFLDYLYYSFLLMPKSF